jgi:hypothetical protein
MFGLIKFTMFVFVAALTGLVATSIPLGGKTMSGRIGEWWGTPTVQKAVADAETRMQRGVEAARQSAPTPAAAPTPKETHDARSKAEVDRIVARRAPPEPDKDHRRQAPPRGK